MARNRCSLSGPVLNESVTEEASNLAENCTALPMVARRTASPKAVAATPATEGAIWELNLSRCSIKGCIFPSAGARGTLCLLHHLTEKEPNHFLSVQPSTMCLDRAKYGVAETEYDNSRARDRRALALQLDRLRNEVA